MARRGRPCKISRCGRGNVENQGNKFADGDGLTGTLEVVPSNPRLSGGVSIEIIGDGEEESSCRSAADHGQNNTSGAGIQKKKWIPKGALLDHLSYAFQQQQEVPISEPDVGSSSGVMGEKEVPGAAGSEEVMLILKAAWYSCV
ncbi:hypothetical protein Dimus_006010, partial [Dionaea muscipula]